MKESQEARCGTCPPRLLAVRSAVKKSRMVTPTGGKEGGGGAGAGEEAVHRAARLNAKRRFSCMAALDALHVVGRRDRLP